jgi:hypothetical protein
MYNYYGPTEVTVYATARRVHSSRRLRSIGIPLSNVTCYVVDPDATAPTLQPIGVWGELWLGGVQVARGYLNRPELTADKFVRNPWLHTDPSGRGVVYRTGDRVRWYADGEIEFGGRIDFQVKLRGQRIELGEIEHALRAQPGVDEVVVLLHADALVAYVSPASVVVIDVVAGGGGFTKAVPFGRVACLAGASAALPAYMLPSVVVGVEEWPRTSSAKIDRKRLPVPSLAAGAAGAEVVPPRTCEERVARTEDSPTAPMTLGPLQARSGPKQQSSRAYQDQPLLLPVSQSDRLRSDRCKQKYSPKRVRRLDPRFVSYRYPRQCSSCCQRTARILSFLPRRRTLRSFSLHRFHHGTQPRN